MKISWLNFLRSGSNLSENWMQTPIPQNSCRSRSATTTHRTKCKSKRERTGSRYGIYKDIHKTWGPFPERTKLLIMNRSLLFMKRELTRHNTGSFFCETETLDRSENRNRNRKRKANFTIAHISVLYSTMFHLPPFRLFTVSEDAGIELRTVATSALAVRSSNHSARSHPLPTYLLKTASNEQKLKYQKELAKKNHDVCNEYISTHTLKVPSGQIGSAWEWYH